MVVLRRRLLLLVAALALLWSGAAQAAEGRLGGTVKDTTGAPVPGVTVTVTNQATNASQTAVTGADGTWSVEAPAGSYTVSVALKGFAKQARKDVASGASADFTLEPQLQEEVTVTAMRREQALTDVPFSVAAPTEEDLRARGVENIESLAANVAGFTIQNLGPGQSQVAMRGVSSGQIVRDQPGVKEQVGAYLDDSIISLSLFTPDLDLFDVGRVEVLRGPQGTLFGAGSLSGTVRYISNQPELGARKWFAEFGGSKISGGTLDGNAKFGGNLPLGQKAAFRFAAYYSGIGGYIDAVQPNLSVKEDVNQGERTGFRAALRFEPSEKLTITPRVVYQTVEMDGWNRIDDYNILGNPFTTTRPKVTLGERQQFTQIEEPFTDDFFLGDLSLRYDFGGVELASISSYTTREVLVVRDATALTASITGGSIGLPASIYTLDAPLDDATTADVFTQEVRLSSSKGKLSWVGGAFYSKNQRDYGQSLLVSGFESLSGIPTRGLRAPRDVLFFSDLSYDLKQFALFGEATWAVDPKLSLTAGLRYYDFSEDRDQIFDGLFGNDDNGTKLVSQPGSTEANGFAPRFIVSYEATDKLNLNAQVSRGFRLGGINDPLNVPLCTAQDLVTFGGRTTWEDETAWNYEVGAKARVAGGKGTFNLAAFDMEITDLQATVTAGSCSSRVIFNVPKARSRGLEVEFSAAPDEHFDFSVSGTFNNSEIRSSIPSASILEGQRLPTVPEVQIAATATYQWQVRTDTLAYLTGSFQHTGSRYTQIVDQASGFGRVNLLSLPNTIGGPLTQNTFTFDPELPAYDNLNLRVGVNKGKWDVAVFGNNLTDERAFLALDQERGTRARVGYLTNQPRTFGFSARVNF